MNKTLSLLVAATSLTTSAFCASTMDVASPVATTTTQTEMTHSEMSFSTTEVAPSTAAAWYGDAGLLFRSAPKAEFTTNGTTTTKASFGPKFGIQLGVVRMQDVSWKGGIKSFGGFLSASFNMGGKKTVESTEVKGKSSITVALGSEMQFVPFGEKHRVFTRLGVFFANRGVSAKRDTGTVAQRIDLSASKLSFGLRLAAGGLIAVNDRISVVPHIGYDASFTKPSKTENGKKVEGKGSAWNFGLGARFKM